jgi:hypothetical protein
MTVNFVAKLFILSTFCLLIFQGASFAQQGLSREELMRKIKELEAQKSAVKADTTLKQKYTRSGSLSDSIAVYEKYVSECTDKSEWCAKVILRLANLYYDEARDGLRIGDR